MKLLLALGSLALFGLSPVSAAAQDATDTSTPAIAGDEPGEPRIMSESPPQFGGRRTRAAKKEEGAEIAADDDSPVVKASKGNIALFFRFGGLGSMLATNNSRAVETLVITQAGLKFVLNERWMVPLTFGAGIRRASQGGLSDDDLAGGFDVGVGLEYHFREWRRISPFFGVNIGGGVSAPADEDLIGGIGLGPTLGIEYYVADRLSLSAQYLMTLQFESSDGDSNLELTTLAGGAMNLTCYF